MLSETIPGVRSIAFGAWVRAASVHEPRDRMGVSHLLEHMVFKGTRSRSAHQIALALETLGGSLDAYTAREHTEYQARALDAHLATAADVVGDLVFQPLLRDDDLQLERKVVLEEISTVEDTPDDLVFELHNEAMWGAHPYGYQILGTRETVSALGVRELRELHTRAYNPPQVVIACAGNVQHVKREGAQTHIVFGSPTVAYGDPRRYAAALVDTILGGGMSSRLFQRVREELGLAYDVHTFQTFHPDTGVHGVYVGTAPKTARDAAAAVRDELARVAADSLTDEEIASGKRQLAGSVTLSLESVTARMYRAASSAHYDEPYRTLDEPLALIEALTAEDVAAVCAEFYAPEKQTVVSLGPERAIP